MTENMTGSLEFSAKENSGSYEYSAAYLAPKEKQFIGTWKVIEHTTDGIPYEDAYCKATFKNIKAENVHYNAIYEFSRHHCIKKVTIYAELNMSGKMTVYEFRMNVVLTWELKPGALQALPILGYQYSILDGKPSAVRDLPPANAAISLSLRFEDDCMILEDGSDIKKLKRELA